MFPPTRCIRAFSAGAASFGSAELCGAHVQAPTHLAEGRSGSPCRGALRKTPLWAGSSMPTLLLPDSSWPVRERTLGGRLRRPLFATGGLLVVGFVLHPLVVVPGLLLLFWASPSTSNSIGMDVHRRTRPASCSGQSQGVLEDTAKLTVSKAEQKKKKKTTRAAASGPASASNGTPGRGPTGVGRGPAGGGRGAVLLAEPGAGKTRWSSRLLYQPSGAGGLSSWNPGGWPLAARRTAWRNCLARRLDRPSGT